MRRKFETYHIQQMLTVSPILFSHQWIMKQGKWELQIDIPSNIKELISNPQAEPSQKPYEGIMLGELIEKRSKFFHQKLLEITYDQFLVTKENYRDIEQYKDFMEIDPLKHKQWPSFFDLNSVKDIERAPLKEYPQKNRVQSIQEFVNNFNGAPNSLQMMITQTSLSKAADDVPVKLEQVSVKQEEEDLNKMEKKDDGQFSGCGTIMTASTAYSGMGGLSHKTFEMLRQKE